MFRGRVCHLWHRGYTCRLCGSTESGYVEERIPARPETKRIKYIITEDNHPPDHVTLTVNVIKMFDKATEVETSDKSCFLIDYY